MNLAPTSVSKAPNDLVTATMRKLVGREEKREVVGNFEAVELQPHCRRWKNQAERNALLEAEQKATRDARYAARKAAKKQRRRGY